MRVDLPADRPRLTLSLPDGLEVTLSPLTADDRELLEDGLEHLSIESRFTRFGQGLSHLTESELEYLTNVDQRTHVAWGASIGGESAGVGRYVCLKGVNGAEVAVTVLDEFQGRGLGTLLFQALTAIARSDGIGEFRFEFVPGNAAVERMTRLLDVRLDESGSLLEGRVSVDALPKGENDGELVAVMDSVRGETEGG